MTIVNKKFYDSAFTLPLATTQSTSAIKLKTIPYALLCSRETGAAPAPIPHTDLTCVKLVMGLLSWCREVEGTQECEERLFVAQEIQKCYVLKRTTLRLSDCPSLTSLPPEIGNLSQLTMLVLSCRALTSLPAEIGNLSQLEILVLNCPALTSLPNELARLPSSCTLNTERCGLNARASMAFQDAITRARMENPTHGPQWHTTVYETRLSDTRTFDETLEQYLTLIDKIPELKTKDLSWLRNEAFKNQFSEEEKDLLNQFLKRIKGTEDFKNSRTQGNVLATISHILEACSTLAFRENLFVLIHEALASCSDRIAITLNRIEIQRRLLSSELTSDLKKFSHFLITYQRLQLVHEQAVEIIKKKGLGDAIEPMLFLQIQLKELLDLPIATEGMLYPAMAHISNQEVESIGHTILSQSESKEQHTKILCTSQQTIYDTTGKPTKIGNLSPTNPFLLDIPTLWKEALIKQHPEEFQKIEPPFETENLHQYFTPEELQEYNKAADPETIISRVHTQKIQALILELTNNII